ncbi:MAG: site-specific DNA-methyltransferase, partial [Elusimicrobia bacterium]|nr:site-specific DNA-methyltransferase [Elusimicrobiota bacterium]
MNLVTIQEAAKWASIHLDKSVTISNISYLIQYGKIKKYSNNGCTLIDIKDLERYYKTYHGKRELSWKKKL